MVPTDFNPRTRVSGISPRARLTEFVKRVLDEEIVFARKDTEIDGQGGASPSLTPLISAQFNAVMHPEDFRSSKRPGAACTTWCTRPRPSPSLKIRVLNVTKRELGQGPRAGARIRPERDVQEGLRRGIRHLRRRALRRPDRRLRIRPPPEDIEFLEKMSHVAAAAHAPFISAAEPELFDWDELHRAAGPRDLAKIFDTVEYAKWKSFRESEDSRYVGLALPHILGRLPYGQDDAPVEASISTKTSTARTTRKYLWCNAAYAFATRLTDAFAKYGWCAAIRGVEGGGLVEDLPTHTFKTDEGDVALKCPTEIAITDRREKELTDLGFIPLVHCKNTDYAAFFGAQSARRPKLRHRRGQRQRPAVVAAAVHHRRLAHRPLHEGDDARQDRQLHAAGRVETS